MEFKKILEHEASLTQLIRNEAADFEKRANDYLNELMLPWEGDIEEEEEEEV